MQERRKFSRVVYQTSASIEQNGVTWKSNILDLSLKGALLSTPSNWIHGNHEDYEITFQLNESDINIEMDLKLVQENKEHLRFEIDHIDINSASHLKRLIELNVGNDALLHRELEQLTDLKEVL